MTWKSGAINISDEQILRVYRRHLLASPQWDAMDAARKTLGVDLDCVLQVTVETWEPDWQPEEPQLAYRHKIKEIWFWEANAYLKAGWCINQLGFWGNSIDCWPAALWQIIRPLAVKNTTIAR